MLVAMDNIHMCTYEYKYIYIYMGMFQNTVPNPGSLTRGHDSWV